MQSWLGNQERRWVSQGHVSPPEDSLAPAGRNTLPFLDTVRSLLRPSCFVRAVPGPHPQLSLPDSPVWLPLPRLCRCPTKPSKESFPRAPGWGAPTPTRLCCCAQATFLRAAVSLGCERYVFVWFSLSPEDKAQASFIFEFPAPGIELAHFSFSKCLLSKGIKSQTNE